MAGEETPVKYDPMRVFESRRPFNLKDKRDITPQYLDKVMAQLDTESKRLGEECVIGVWVSRWGLEYRNAGFGLYRRSEAEHLMQMTAQYGPVSPFFNGYVDRKMLQELKRRLSVDT